MIETRTEVAKQLKFFVGQLSTIESMFALDQRRDADAQFALLHAVVMGQSLKNQVDALGRQCLDARFDDYFTHQVFDIMGDIIDRVEAYQALLLAIIIERNITEHELSKYALFIQAVHGKEVTHTLEDGSRSAIPSVSLLKDLLPCPIHESDGFPWETGVIPLRIIKILSYECTVLLMYKFINYTAGGGPFIHNMVNGLNLHRLRKDALHLKYNAGLINTFYTKRKEFEGDHFTRQFSSEGHSCSSRYLHYKTLEHTSESLFNFVPSIDDENILEKIQQIGPIDKQVLQDFEENLDQFTAILTDSRARYAQKKDLKNHVLYHDANSVEKIVAQLSLPEELLAVLEMVSKSPLVIRDDGKVGETRSWSQAVALIKRRAEVIISPPKYRLSQGEYDKFYRIFMTHRNPPQRRFQQTPSSLIAFKKRFGAFVDHEMTAIVPVGPSQSIDGVSNEQNCCISGNNPLRSRM